MPFQELLVERVKIELQKWNETLVRDRMPSDATKLSYWMTQNLPLDDSLKLHLLSTNTAQQRLRCALNIIVKVMALLNLTAFNPLLHDKVFQNESICI